MGHALLRREGDIVARLDELVFGETQTVALNNLLGQGLGDSDRSLSIEVVGDTGLFEQRGEDIGGGGIS